MYANLLANSMNKVVKNGVHPGFVEIIKQLCPDEAKILQHITFEHTIPTITLRYVHNDGGGIDIIKNFSDIGERAGCEHPYEIAKYFDNLVRLGLIFNASGLATLTKKERYEPLKNHPYLTSKAITEKAIKMGFNKVDFEEGFYKISSYGESFCSICLETANTITIL